VPAAAVAPQRAALDRADRQGLARLGIRLGTEFVYLDRLLKPDAVAMRALLWSVEQGAALPPPVPEPGRLAVVHEGRSAEFCAAIGYFLLGAHAVRVDRVERLAAAARRLARQGPFAATPELAAAAGVSVDDLTSVLPMRGYRAIVQESGVTFVPRKGRHQIRNGKRPKRVQPGPPMAPGEDNPFAKLRALRLAR
jgi:ATP-dependent RNA helicase SUPV3L1/SUV3